MARDDRFNLNGRGLASRSTYQPQPDFKKLRTTGGQEAVHQQQFDKWQRVNPTQRGK